MWMALKRANIDDVHLLRMKKLEVPAKSLNDTVKSCIVKYLQAIKPVAFVKLSAESNESCSVRVVQQHADILRMASRKGFRCLKLYKIGISNVYSDAPQVLWRRCFIVSRHENYSRIFRMNLQLSEDDQKALDITFTNCLTELETKATTDMELLNGRVVDCTNEMAGIGTSTLETNDETNTDITEASTSTDDDTENQIEIVGAQNVSSLTSWAAFYLLKNPF